MASISLIAAMFVEGTVATMVCLCIGAAGIFACTPLFWTIPAQFLTGTAAATGIAVINSIGNLGGFFGPTAVGMVKDATGDFRYGLLLLGVSVLIGGIMCFYMNNRYQGKVNFDKAHEDASKLD